MATTEPAAPSRFAAFRSKTAVVYLALMLPAVVLELVFSLAVASSPGDLLSLSSPLGPTIASAAQVFPLLLLLASLFAILSFRPSILVTLLVATFFVAVSVVNGLSILGAQPDLGELVILVILAVFLVLAGFNYARGLKLLSGRQPMVTSSGPLGYNVFSLALETAVPVAAALALVLFVQLVVGTLGVQSARLPAPLSTLTSLYLQSRIGLVFTTLLVAGAAIWVMRQFVEPLVLHFTLTRADARNELLSEIQPTTKSVSRVARYRPSGGLAWGFLTIAYCLGIFAALAIFLPRGQLSHDLISIFNLHASSPTPTELLLQNAFQDAIVRADILFAQSQDYIREGIRLLWG